MAEGSPTAGTLGTYARMLAAQARGQLQYRVSFAFDVTGSFVIAVTDLLQVLVLYRVSRALGGFAFREALLMAGIATCGFALADLAVGNIDRMRAYVRTGLLDTLLVRPLGALGQLVVADFAPRRVGRVLLTGAVMLVAVSRADVAWTPGRVALLVVAPLSAAVLFGSVFVASATVTFWWIDSGEFASGLTYGGRDFTSYPLPVYGTVFRTVLGYAMGYAFAGYHPALTLLGREDPLGAPGWAGWCSPLVALAAAGVAAAVWRTGIRHYRSTGS